MSLTTAELAASPMASRGLALAILVALVGVLYLGIAAPLFERYEDARQSITRLQAALERYQRLGRDLPARQAELAALRQRQATQEGLLEGGSETLLAAQIQNRIKTLVEQAHGELQSTQALPGESEGKLRRIMVRAQMSVSLPAAQQIFHGLEAGYPLLFLDNIDTRAQQPGRRQGELPHNDVILDIRFDVEGYMRDAGK